jgi:RNA-binding protein 23/39
MSGLDVEALLDSTATNGNNDADSDRFRSERSERRERDHERDDSKERERKRRDRSRDRRRDRDDDDLRSPRSDRGSANGSHRSRHRSRSRDTDKRRSHRDDERDHHRRRSRSPRDDRYYRPSSHREDDRRDRDRNDRKRSRSPRKDVKAKSKTPEPQLTEDERDRRTVFVQQLAARLRTKELISFFEKVGPVKEAQIVKDRVSGRSKGSVHLPSPYGSMLTFNSVGYVEFRNEDSVPLAIQMTGQKLLGIPIIAQLTEAEKNRQARNPEAATSTQSSVPFHRLYVGNIHFSITEQDLLNVFEPFGELEFVQLQKEEGGRSRGYGFVQ